MAKSCNNCHYGASKGKIFVICKFFNKVIDTRKTNYCSRHVSKKYSEKNR